MHVITFGKKWNKTKIIFKRNPPNSKNPIGNNNYVSQENYYKYHPKTSQNTPSKTRILINSLHPTPPNTSSSSSLSLTNSLILSLELKNSRSSKKNERRRKPIFLSLLFFHCCNWVPQERKYLVVFYSTHTR